MDVVNCFFCGVAVELEGYLQHLDGVHITILNSPERAKEVVATGVAAAARIVLDKKKQKEGIENLLSDDLRNIACLKEVLRSPLEDLIRCRLVEEEERKFETAAALVIVSDSLGQAEADLALWQGLLKIAEDRLFWDKLLRQLGDFPGAVLTGGAIRDFVLGRVAEDFDIFVPLEGMTFEVAVTAISDIDIIPEKTIKVMQNVLVERRYYRGYQDVMVDKTVKDFLKDEARNYVSFIWESRRVDIVFMPCQRGEMVARLRAEFVHPLNMGVYDGRQLDLPEIMLQDLSDKEVSVLESQIPSDIEGLVQVTKRTRRLAEKLGWKVRVMK